MVLAGLIVWAWILLAGPQSVADTLGVWLVIPRVTVSWTIEQVIAVILATACAGVLLGEWSWVKPAIVAAWAMVAIQVVRSLEALVLSRRLAIPLSILVYGLFAVILSGVRRRSDPTSKTSREGR